MGSLHMAWERHSSGTLIVLLAFLATACGGTPLSPSGQSILHIQLTDAPTDEVSEVNVFIVGLTIKHSEKPVEQIANEFGLVDLLDLEDASVLLVSLSVESGSYDFIQVDLDESRSYVVESGERKLLQIPSTEIKVLGGFEVPEGEATTLLLDFDVNQSLVHEGNGEWLLQPVIVMQQVTTG